MLAACIMIMHTGTKKSYMQNTTLCPLTIYRRRTVLIDERHIEHRQPLSIAGLHCCYTVSAQLPQFPHGTRATLQRFVLHICSNVK